MALWVIYNRATGYSDESMRVATFDEARAIIDGDIEGDVAFAMRWESDEPHPHNHVALAQLWLNERWQDYARDTPEAAINWAQGEIPGTARVVDWVSREVMWP